MVLVDIYLQKETECSCQPTVDSVVSDIIDHIFLCTNSRFLSGLMTAQEIDPFPVQRLPLVISQWTFFQND